MSVNLPIPVRSIRRPRRALESVWTAPPSPAKPPVPSTDERIALEVRAELDVMVSQMKMPTGPVELPDSGLCHGAIRESFQGFEIEYFCVRRAGHAEPCSPGSDDSPAAPDDLSELDHQGAWGCLDAPVVT